MNCLQFGAFPVFVVDGIPSPLKSQARIARFFRSSGIDLSGFSIVDDSVPVERNRSFTKCVEECVELLKLLGIPVLKARGEAEALCAQLNREGQVDACITADSDAFLFGAACVIKGLRPSSKEPFECYHISDIESGLGLKRKHLIAIALLVGSDHDLNGVQGIGLDTALRFVQTFREDEILNRLHEICKGDEPDLKGEISVGDPIPSLDVSSPKTKLPHCSLCGHPGSKRVHLKFACEYCSGCTSEGCMTKPVGFKCKCVSCNMNEKKKEQKKVENWHIRVCKKIAMEKQFPNDEIIRMYLSNDHAKDGDSMLWESPKTDMVVDFLAYHLHWDPSYVRQRMLPLLSTVFLREMASNPSNDLLNGQYEFDSIRRVKLRYGHEFYVVNWKKSVHSTVNSVSVEEADDVQEEELREIDERVDLLDEPDAPQIQIENGCCFLLTDENMELVRAAFPEKVTRFLEGKEVRESKSKRKKPEGSGENSESRGQLSIKEFYRSTKVACQLKSRENAVEEYTWVKASPGKKRKEGESSSSNLPKSVRRRLLFG